MGNQAAFASSVHNTSTELSATVETNQGVPAQSTSCFVAGSAGSKIEEIVAVVMTTAAGLAPVTVAGLIYLYLFDGTTYHYFDSIAVSAVTGSATTAPYRSAPSRYPNLWLQSGWSLVASVSVQPTTGRLKLNIFGGDY